MAITGGELPPFSVRESDRARNIRLTVTPHEGLVVVVPRGARVDAHAIVASKRRWASKALAQVAEKRALHAAGPRALLPHTIDLRMTDESFVVDYEATASTRVMVTEAPGARLIVRGSDDAEVRLAALRRWLDRRAREVLPARLAQLATESGVTVTRVRVTSARSRWGSCSSRGTVSLNRAVLFFPAELADALIHHELAHRTVMDHSPRFWAHLCTLDPDAMRHRASLKKAAGFVPAWADA